MFHLSWFTLDVTIMFTPARSLLVCRISIKEMFLTWALYIETPPIMKQNRITIMQINETPLLITLHYVQGTLKRDEKTPKMHIRIYNLTFLFHIGKQICAPPVHGTNHVPHIYRPPPQNADIPYQRRSDQWWNAAVFSRGYSILQHPTALLKLPHQHFTQPAFRYTSTFRNIPVLILQMLSFLSVVRNVYHYFPCSSCIFVTFVRFKCSRKHFFLPLFSPFLAFNIVLRVAETRLYRCRPAIEGDY